MAYLCDELLTGFLFQKKEDIVLFYKKSIPLKILNFRLILKIKILFLKTVFIAFLMAESRKSIRPFCFSQPIIIRLFK